MDHAPEVRQVARTGVDRCPDRSGSRRYSRDVARSCVFCRKAGVTAEHVWPAWLSEVVPGTGELAFVRKGMHEPKETRWNAPSLNVTVRQVCASCNSGWMSELETEAKPLLTPMIQGKPMGLSRREQRLAATWAAKTAMMLAFTHPERRALPDAHLHWLYAQGEPDPHVVIWIGAYAGDWSGWYSGEILGLGPRERPEGFAYCSTCLLGSLVFQVLGHDLNEAMAPLAAPEADRLSVQIWPDTRALVRWPPDFTLRDGGLHLFASQFAAGTA